MEQPLGLAPLALPQDPTALVLAYFVVPLWLFVGLLDWFCHRETSTETTTGAKESLIHLAMFFELGAPLFSAAFVRQAAASRRGPRDLQEAAEPEAALLT